MIRKFSILLFVAVFFFGVMPSNTFADTAFSKKWEANNPCFSVVYSEEPTGKAGMELNFGYVFQNGLSIGTYNPKYYPEGSRVNILMIDGGVVPDSNIVISNGTTLVPIKLVSEILGARVTWNGQSRTVGIAMKDKNMTLQIGSIKARVGDKDVILSIAPQIINGSTYVPLRFIADSFGYEIGYSPLRNDKNNFVYFVTIDNVVGKKLLADAEAIAKVRTEFANELENCIALGTGAEQDIQKVSNIKYTGKIGIYNSYIFPQNVHEGTEYGIFLYINRHTGEVFCDTSYSMVLEAISPIEYVGIHYQ